MQSKEERDMINSRKKIVKIENKCKNAIKNGGSSSSRQFNMCMNHFYSGQRWIVLNKNYLCCGNEDNSKFKYAPMLSWKFIDLAFMCTRIVARIGD